ncbi:MORN-repeat protein [Orpheovirus IHUMI-LCC2]|uniref:MORN-repeat protein n=1 Tax=Orpheovirus IHUMI-LCC2 TaxID=2023057 RepID=A0A2I2L5D5_9VIRU|nr:MORN-repeat protein [Orpheovirus IHUMI-LCC2]SNW62669.1 MORN-repeat protein [Orpheovirus IHUMI-LCC2]
MELFNLPDDILYEILLADFDCYRILHTLCKRLYTISKRCKNGTSIKRHFLTYIYDNDNTYYINKRNGNIEGLYSAPLSTSYYRNGKLHGTKKEYYVNGRLRKYENYKNGEKSGMCISYHNSIDKRIFLLENYREDGLYTTVIQRYKEYTNVTNIFGSKRFKKTSYRNPNFILHKVEYEIYDNDKCVWNTTDRMINPKHKNMIYSILIISIILSLYVNYKFIL